MPSDSDRCLRWSIERLLPVALTPPGRPTRIDCDDPQAGVGRHADQQVTDLARWHPRHDAAEAIAALTVAEGLSSELTSVAEVEVLNRDPLAAVALGEVEYLGDRCAQPTVTSTGR
jgi:hypothetical protein